MQKIYWIDFDGVAANELPMGTKMGVGVAARDETDAVELVRDALFQTHTFPTSYKIKEVRHLDKLEQNHVRPNMAYHLKRGVWFPAGLPS